MRCSRPTTGTNLRFSTAQELATRPVQIYYAAETVGGVLARNFYYISRFLVSGHFEKKHAVVSDAALATLFDELCEQK